MSRLRIIGDVHEEFNKYKRIAGEAEHSVQIGDLGYHYDQIADLDADRHKFFYGNHDKFDSQPPHWLGRYGSASLAGTPFFFIGGEHTLDWRSRTIGVDLFPDEELSGPECLDCYEKYGRMRPEIVLSHGVPREIALKIGKPEILRAFGLREDWTSRTSYFLQSLLERHQPKIWVAGHFHMSRSIQIGRCSMHVLPILGHIDL